MRGGVYNRCTLGLVPEYGNDNHLDGRDFWRQDQTCVVAVGHDDPSNRAARDAPAGAIRMLPHVVAAGKRDVVYAGEVLPQVVAGARLEGFAV